MRQFLALEREIREKIPDLEIKTDEPMKEHTSFRIGGPCDLMLLPKSEEALRAALALLSEKGAPPLLLGAGSNVLIPDEGLRRVVIVTRDALCALRQLGETGLLAQSGVMLARLSMFAAERGLSGLEFAQGIPGTVGGGIFMNAGAYGGELRDAAVRTSVLRMDGSREEFIGDAQELSYRSSAFQRMECVILETEFRLTRGDGAEIRAKMQELAAKRRAKQPLELPSAGSAFKRPEGHFAAALIEEAGLKGFRIGGAAVSEKHAGFVVNLGGATAQDVLRLLDAVAERVYQHSGVRLEPEIRLIRG